jgi:hypothetical protein
MDTFVQVVRDMLGEAYNGSTGRPWFSDHGPNSGLVATLEGISAEQASTPPTPGGSSIAAHTHHLRWSLERANAAMRGDRTPWNWAESWALQRVDAAAWDELRNSLKLEVSRVKEALPNGFDPNNPMMLQSGVALVAHAAYHLGAIRQMAMVVRSNQS